LANKEQIKVLQPEKKDEKAVQDKKTQAVAKPKKSAAPAAQTKKRRFTFFADVIGELRKVAWPTRDETIRLTLIVIGACVIMGAILGGIDFAFSWLVQQVLIGGK
jgi:preprotein translocase subunit SecE